MASCLFTTLQSHKRYACETTQLHTHHHHHWNHFKLSRYFALVFEDVFAQTLSVDCTGFYTGLTGKFSPNCELIARGLENMSYNSLFFDLGAFSTRGQRLKGLAILVNDIP